MSDSGSAWLGGVIAGIIVATLFWVPICILDYENLRQEAVDKGFAAYNSQTGDWEWREGGR